jgi:hypothetical protein
MTNASKTALIAQETGLKNTGVSLKNEERQRCEIWSRCMGYHRPVSNYNIGKKQEYSERKVFKEPSMEVLNGSVN